MSPDTSSSHMTTETLPRRSLHPTMSHSCPSIHCRSICEHLKVERRLTVQSGCLVRQSINWKQIDPTIMFSCTIVHTHSPTEFIDHGRIGGGQHSFTDRLSLSNARWIFSCLQSSLIETQPRAGFLRPRGLDDEPQTNKWTRWPGKANYHFLPG
jgi:hypothetical protein